MRSGNQMKLLFTNPFVVLAQSLSFQEKFNLLHYLLDKPIQFLYNGHVKHKNNKN
jgi:hypothetical protein